MERSDSNSVEEQLLILNKSLYCSDFKLFFRPRHLLIHESFTTGEVSFEYNAEELGNVLTLLANLEESGTGIRHEVGLAAFGINGYADFGYYYQVALGKAESEAVHSDNVVSRERQRADKAESQIKGMLAIPEIKEIWETIQQNKCNFTRQLNQWIDNALKAIAHFAAYEKNIHFSEQQSSAISMVIIAKAFKSGLDVTDDIARIQATQNLLDEVDWSETSSYK